MDKKNSIIQNKPLTTPVLLLIFRRPEMTQKVFNQIKKARPKKLFVAADGPRKNIKEEIEQCRLTREVVKQVDWKCKVYKKYSDKNLGLKMAVSSAIDWFFNHVEAGIILEDDCLPNQSFFWFCQELLEKYKDDERIMMVCGSNFQCGQTMEEGSYFFSKLARIWGWATWRRAWKLFDLSLKDFPEFKRQEQIKNIFNDKIVQKFWLTKISDTYEGSQSWAFAWAYTILKQNGLCICSNKNLVSNIGFGLGAVNARYSGSVFDKVKTEEIRKLIHPRFIIPNNKVDEFVSRIAAKEQMPKLFFTKRIKYLIISLLVNFIPKAWRKKITKLIKYLKIIFRR